MSTQTTDPTELLERMTASARDEVSETELDAAARRFRAALPSTDASAATPSARQRPFGRWFGFAGAVATLVVAVTVLPLLLPGKTAGSAFAQAQAWFADYGTLQLTLETRQGTLELYRMSVWHERGGATRIDVGPVSHIVDPARGVMLTLGPDGQLMSRQALPGGMTGPGDQEELAWLDELRDFRGQAEALDTHRDIDGVDAQGWSLELSGIRQTLWVDPVDFRPLLLEGLLGGDVTMTTRFIFDAPLPADVFTPKAAFPVPPGEGS